MSIIKKFDGKPYKKRDYDYDTKRDATKAAKGFRDVGQLVRVVSGKDKYGKKAWYLYVHIPKKHQLKGFKYNV